MRPGIDVLHHRVFARRIEVRRTNDHAVDVGLPVAPLGDERLWRLPAERVQRGRVGALELRDERTIAGAAKLEHRRLIDSRPDVDEKLHVVRVRHVVRAVGLSDRREAGTVEIDPIGVDEVRVLARVHAARLEPDLACDGIDLVDLAHDPRSGGDLTLHLSGHAVVEVKVVPPVAL
jgi:hypothetical protein